MGNVCIQFLLTSFLISSNHQIKNFKAFSTVQCVYFIGSEFFSLMFYFYILYKWGNERHFYILDLNFPQVERAFQTIQQMI